MIHNYDDDNLDNIDLYEIFNDFYENQSSVSRATFPKSDSKVLLSKNIGSSTNNQDNSLKNDRFDCIVSKTNQKQLKSIRRLHQKQTTMYDYASSVSYRHKKFYSSWDNTTTTKIFVKGLKRSIEKDHEIASSISKKSKAIDINDSSLSLPRQPDFIDNLLRYFDERNGQKYH